MKDRREWIEAIITAFLDSPENRLWPDRDEKAWERVIVGFSNGADPLYAFFKQDIGDFYWTPVEAFRTAYPSREVLPSELTVVSWILPQTDATKADNRAEKKYPAERWARARKFGEGFQAKLRAHLVAGLREAGIDAMSPINSPEFKQVLTGKYGHASCWSERHAAYVSGLGTFGLSDGLITPAGKAIRCGSVVARIDITPSERPYAEPHAYCLFHAEGTCGACVKRCPVDAITKEKGHDKVKCREYLRGVTEGYSIATYGVEIYACGLCQTGVPCESRIPLKGQRKGKAAPDEGRP